jgi:prepilin-type N-terminal cleavage/methylation domain-containing protein
MKRLYGRQGFSLLELLTVIAIIAILAAILFPIMKAAKDRARTSQCISHLHDIYVGLKTYRIDNNRYPDCLLGYYDDNVKDINKASGALYPEYVHDIEAFTCPSGGSGDPSSPTPIAFTVLGPGGQPAQVKYYMGDSYDWTDMTGTGGAMATYAVTWCPPGAGGSLNPGGVDSLYSPDPDKPVNTDTRDIDYARQLRFRSPDDTTVVTWCMNHRNTDKAQVLFLSGQILPVPAAKMKRTAVGGQNVLYRTMP